MAEQQPDVIDVLEQDHREVEAMFGELESLRGARGETARTRRKELAQQVVIELVRHSGAEEAEVYPAVQERISAAGAERARHEHAEAEVTMKRLEALRPDDDSFDDELATLMREIREHVAEEESGMFVQMREVFTPQELRDLAVRVARVKKVSPTRPHPAAPDVPPANKLLNPATGLIDQVRDAVSGRGTGRRAKG